MSSKQKIDKNGFTILEVMIVLAVTMIIFFMATQFIAGKEQYNAFKVSLNSLQTEFKDIFNNVANGYVPAQNISCSASGTSKPAVSTSSSNQQGSNLGCIFLGDEVQIKTTGIVIYPIIGNRTDSNGNQVYNIIDGNGTAIISSNISPETYSFSNGLNAICAQTNLTNSYQSCDNTTLTNVKSPTNSFAVGISSASSQNNQALVVIPTADLHNLSNNNVNNDVSNTTFVNDFNLPGDIYIGAANELVGGINICVLSGGSNNSAMFTIGGNGSVNNVTYFIYNNRNCSNA